MNRRRVASVFDSEDRDALIAEARRLDARTALEFGPGYSTQALLDAGMRSIDSCEHDRAWRLKARRRFAGPRVRIHRYDNVPVVSVPGIDAAMFDMAFVDSPNGEEKRRVRLPGQEECARLNTVLYAIGHAPVVLLHDARRPGEQATLARCAALGHRVSMIETVKGIARIERAA